MLQLVQEDIAAYSSGCLPERSSAAGCSSYSFCPCPGQHGSTIHTQQQRQQQQDSASWSEPEEDEMQELCRQISEGISGVSKRARVSEVVCVQHRTPAMPCMR
jgi:hypothetical protein